MAVSPADEHIKTHLKSKVNTFCLFILTCCVSRRHLVYNKTNITSTGLRMCVVEKKQAFVARHNLSMSDQCLDKMFRSLSNAKGLDEELFLDMMASKPYLEGFVAEVAKHYPAQR